MGSNSKDGRSSSLSPDFMSRLRATEAKAHMRPDLRQRVMTELVTLRDDMRELKSLMGLVLHDVKRVVQVQYRSKASKNK